MLGTTKISLFDHFEHPYVRRIILENVQKSLLRVQCFLFFVCELRTIVTSLNHFLFSSSQPVAISPSNDSHPQSTYKNYPQYFSPRYPRTYQIGLSLLPAQWHERERGSEGPGQQSHWRIIRRGCIPAHTHTQTHTVYRSLLVYRIRPRSSAWHLYL